MNTKENRTLFQLKRGIRLQEVDAAGVVFFSRVFEYMHDAYAAWLDQMGFPLATLLQEQRYTLPLVHASADYASPLRFGEAVLIEITHVRLGNRSFTVHYKIRSEESPSCVHATGQTVHVCLESTTGIPCALPDPLCGLLKSASKNEGGVGTA